MHLYDGRPTTAGEYTLSLCELQCSLRPPASSVFEVQLEDLTRNVPIRESIVSNTYCSHCVNIVIYT